MPTPFIDADDIADVAVAALTDDQHIGRLYELTGSRSLTFAEAAAEIAEESGREVRYVPVSPDEHAAEAAEHGVPPEVVELSPARPRARSVDSLPGAVDEVEPPAGSRRARRCGRAHRCPPCRVTPKSSAFKG